jgi:hypothetical protein
MPNGDYTPECFNCAHYTKWEDIRVCQQHDFVMPRTGAFAICRDWTLHPKHQHDLLHYDYVPEFLELEEFLALEPGILYACYRYLKYYAFGSFEALQFPIIQIKIHKDDELGWCFYVNNLYRRFLPDNGTTITLNLDENKYTFKVTDVERVLESGGGRTGPSGEWEIHYSRSVVRAIHCPGEPNALYNWLDSYVDLEGLLTDNRKGMDGRTWGELQLRAGIFSYIEMRDHNTGIVHPKKLMENLTEYERRAIARI